MKQLAVVTMLGLVFVATLNQPVVANAAPAAPTAPPAPPAPPPAPEKRMGPPGPTTAHGTNFQVKNGLDITFCMDIAAGTTENRGLLLSQCSPTTTQRFAFTWNGNDTNTIVETQGMCVDTRGKKPGDGTAVVVQKCRHDEDQRFSFTAAGLIRELHSQHCLSVSRAAAGVAVTLERCDETKKQQTWKLSQ